jgi:hypothetical protein
LPGKLSCLPVAVFEPLPISIDEVIARGSIANFVETPVVISFSNLIPDTDYIVHCVVSDRFRTVTSYSQMIQDSSPAKTTCCQRLMIELKQKYFRSTSPSPEALRIKFDGRSPRHLHFDISGRRHGTSDFLDLFYPNTFSVEAFTIPSPVTLILLNCPPPGEYEIVINGTFQSSEFEIIFPFFQSFNVLDNTSEPPVPKVLSTQFSDDGFSVIISFDSSTDQASFVTEFNCSLLMKFPSALTSKCLFTDPCTLSITLSSSSVLLDGNHMNFQKGKLRALCHLSSAECQSWGSVIDFPFKVRPPNVPLLPVVKIRGSLVMSPCDPPIFDLSLSTGAGGRMWASCQVSVFSTNDESIESISRIDEYFSISYDVNARPIPAPSGLFRSGYWYNLRFTLCNFLSSCNSGDYLIEVMNSTIPSLVLLNSRQVSQSVLSPVSLGVSAFTVQCDDGLKSFSQFNFLWTVFRDGVEDKSLKSLSKNPSKFVLSPKTLQFGSTYRISILVTHQGTLLSNSDEYFVTLVSSPLVVAIGGPTRRALKLGEVITVDGTKSYDPDGVSSTLKMTWQCFRVKPSFSQICDLALYHRSPGLIDISATNASVVGFQFNLSLAVSDTTRRSFSSILIDVAPPEAPTISISLPSSDVPPSRWNQNRDLVVSGTILTSVPGRAYWRVENAGVSLKNLNGTGSSKPIRPGLNSFNLLLKGGSLPPSDHFPYVLSLQATDQSSVASVQIFMNSPPRSGQFSVTPDIGISMVTQFAFFASQWIDSDLPLSYEFSYYSGGISLPLQSRSEFSSTSSFLPVGTQRDGGSVVCSVTVFDILGSRTNASHSVKVTTDSVVVGTVAETVTSKLLEAQGNLELTRQLISVSSSLMSVRNCTGAPNCASLNRDECLKTDHMCGACLPNYLGAPGDGNNLCLSITENEEPFSTCSDDSNCFSWQFCSKDSCSPRSRHCDDDCSHHGDCQFQTIDSGETIPFCAVTDLTCEATCECDQGWNGPTCAITDSEIQSRSLLRDVLLAQLRELTKVDEPSIENIDSWTSSLSSLSIARDELSSLGIFLVSNISEIILASSPSVSTLVNLCESLDGVTRGQKNGRRLLSEHSSVNSLLTRTGLMLAQSLIPEAPDYEVIQSSFRLSTPLLSSSQPQATALQTPLEIRSHMPTSFCTIAGLGDDEESRLTFLSLKSKYFSGPSTSNPLSLQMAAANLSHFPSFLCVLYHHLPQNFTEVMSPEYLNVTCPSGEERIFEKDCFGGNLGNVTISLTCNGTAATLSKRCPTLKTEGVCVSFGDDSPFQCTTVRYDSISTTCSCNQSSLGNRRLSNSEASLLQVSSFPFT